MIACRTSVVKRVFVNTVSQAGIVQFGDTKRQSDQRNRGIAVQRAVPNFEGDEVKFASYPLFFLPRPKPGEPLDVAVTTASDDGAIRVGRVSVLGVSTSSIFRVGCGGPHDALARVLHIRHFNDRVIR
ncbi:spore germination protein GerPE [Cohnella massiliensis]|uniref:spore germination protein GerPE n=1 Tax=Cohnella massiliensis TaxID=1816691 RepID=UPI00111AA829|nr:spore germination protein GerPE [Cohnella massiliensis]